MKLITHLDKLSNVLGEDICINVWWQSLLADVQKCHVTG